MTKKIYEAVLKLDEAVSLYPLPHIYNCSNFLTKSPPSIPENAGLCFSENIDENGVIFNIGGSDFDFIGKRYIFSLQPIFSDYPGFLDKGGFVFIVQNDVSPVFIADDGSIWGGLVADDNCHFFGKNMEDFINMITECYILKFSKYKDKQYKNEQGYNALLSEVGKLAIKSNINPDDWIEYFYG